MSRCDIRHPGVTGQDGRLIGWISSREMVRQRVTSAIVIGDQLNTATQPSELHDAIKALPMLANALVRDAVPGQHVAVVISSQYRAALAHANTLDEQQMRDDGHWPPPFDYAMLLLGSVGRDESLLAADQDHAIICADFSADRSEPRQSSFESLGGHVSDYLNLAGIPYCQGGVMSQHSDCANRWVAGAKPSAVRCAKHAPKIY